MEPCLLLDSPTPVFRAVLQQLCSPDHASLRQASKPLSLLTTEHLPFITLRLTDSTSEDHLQQWCQATRQLQHVSSIHVSISGIVSADLFDMAMQLLAQKFSRVTELRVLGSKGVESKRIRGLDPAYQTDPIVITLQPILHLLGQLKSLAIEGIRLENVVADMEQLATASTATGGWQLQSLALTASWGFLHEVIWPVYILALNNIISAFPALQQLTIKQPAVEYPFRPEADAMNPPQATYLRDKMTGVATLAALANAVLRMKQLKLLRVTDLADVWAHSVLHEQPSLYTATTTAAQIISHIKAVLLSLYADVSQSLLASTSAALAAFESMEGGGCWLLQHHPTLEELHICTRTSGWNMCWKKQQTSQHHSNCTSARAKLVDLELNNWSPDLQHGVSGRYLHADSSSASGGDSSNQQAVFAWQIGRYISTCSLKLKESYISSLGVVGCLKSLRHIEVPSMMSVCKAEATASLTSAVAAMGSVTGLQSLVLDYGQPEHLPADFLLPLTAAAGGPGRSLKKLKLVGDFITGCNIKGKLLFDSSYMRSLKQLDGLIELCIKNTKAKSNRELSHLAVESLPVSLEVFSATGIDITSATRASSRKLLVRRKLQLYALHVDGCRIETHSLLCNDQLRELTVTNSTWHGGWPAVACPNVSKLAWKYDTMIIRSFLDSRVCDESEESLPVAAPSPCDRPVPTIKYFMQQVCQMFQGLRSLTVLDVPKLSMDMLQPLVQHQQQLRHMEFQSSYVVAPPGSDSMKEPVQSLKQWLQQQMPWATVHIDLGYAWPW